MNHKLLDKIRFSEEKVREYVSTKENIERLAYYKNDVPSSGYWYGIPICDRVKPIVVELEREMYAKLIGFSMMEYYTNPYCHYLGNLTTMLYKFEQFHDCTPISKEFSYFPGGGFEKSIFGFEPIHSEHDSWVSRELLFPIGDRPSIKDMELLDFYNSGCMPLHLNFYEELLHIASEDFTVRFPQWIPENDIGSVKETEITSFDDERLWVSNPLKYGINETFSLISEEIKKDYNIVPGITGPYSQVVFMMGMEKVLFSMFDESEKLKRVLKARTAVALEWVKELKEMNAECVWIGEGAATSSIISPEQYTEFVLPYAAALIEGLKKEGIYSIMHVCGDINSSIDLIGSTGAECMDIDYMVDLKKGREKINRPICLKGNLNPVNLLSQTPNEIYKECKSIIEQGKGNGGFILSTGCLVPRDTPPENIEAMVKASLHTQLL